MPRPPGIDLAQLALLVVFGIGMVVGGAAAFGLAGAAYSAAAAALVVFLLIAVGE